MLFAWPHLQHDVRAGGQKCCSGLQKTGWLRRVMRVAVRGTGTTVQISQMNLFLGVHPVSCSKWAQLWGWTTLLRALLCYVLETPQDWKLQNFSGQPALHCWLVLKGKKIFRTARLKLSSSSWCLLSFVFPSYTAVQGPTPSSQGAAVRSPKPSLLHAEQAPFCQPLLTVSVSALIILVAIWENSELRPTYRHLFNTDKPKTRLTMLDVV